MPRKSLTARATTRRRGKKWSPVWIDNNQTIQITAGGSSYGTYNLCLNSTSTDSAPTATVIKTGNFKLNFDSQTVNSFSGYGLAVIMFLPQSFDPFDGLPNAHPEWVLAWRSFDPGYSALQSLSMQTKLKRNLNSGDKIILFVKIYNNSSQQQTLNIHYTATYVCCNN